MNPAYIYIDEFGNSHLNLEKSGTFSHFIYTSVVLDESQIEKARIVRKDICQKFRLGPDIKSSNIKNKDLKKRLDILQYLIDNLNFHVDVFIVDKSRINSIGLIEKRTFYKYFQKTFVNKYNDRFSSYYIYADAVGTDFRKELEDFVLNNGVNRDLFNPDRTFQLTNDRTGEKLVQLADFISGCVGKIFCASHMSDKAIEIYRIIQQRTSVEHFPFEGAKTFYLGKAGSEHDEIIKNINLEAIKKYNEKANSQNQEHLRLLEYLQLQSYIDSNRLVSTYDILSYLQNFHPTYSVDKLRLLVRDLRYDGMLIVSHPGKPGYKLASDYNDIREHFNHFLKYVIPMLKKVEVMNKSLSRISNNMVNPIEKDTNMEQLRELINALYTPEIIDK